MKQFIQSDFSQAFFLVTGKIVVYLTIILLLAVFSYWIIRTISNLLSQIYKPMWYVIEWAWYRNEFKEFVKDKDRHPIVKTMSQYSYEDLEWAFEMGQLDGYDKPLKHYLEYKYPWELEKRRRASNDHKNK